MVKKRTTRSAHDLTSLDDVLAAEGALGEFEAVAVKEVIAWQIAAAMRSKNISQRALALRMGTSRTQVSRLLDPNNGNVTIETLQRAAREVGRSLRLELI